MELYDKNPKKQIYPGRKKLKTTLGSKYSGTKIFMGPRLRAVQESTTIYGDVDMGSKRYSMKPAITVNVHWGEVKNKKLHIIVF